jgi:DNA repair protein RadC
MQFVHDFADLTAEEKPREKMMLRGPAALSPWELIAILLRTGIRSKHGTEDVMQLAKRLVAEFGLKGLFHQKDIPELMEAAGIYKSHAELLVAISEVFRRITDSHDAFDAATPSKIFKKFSFLQSAKQEQCHVLHLDHKRRCIFEEIVAIGSGNAVQVSAADVLRSAVYMDRSNIAIVHNHPSSSQPSKQDITWTLALAKGAKELLGIAVTEHIIIGHDGYFSFSENNFL